MKGKRIGILPVNLFQPSVVLHIDTNHFVCNANQVTGFYIQCNIGLKCVKKRKFVVVNSFE